MAQTIELSGFDQLEKSWDTLLKQFPQERKAVLEKLGQQILEKVQREIGGTGKVAGWQAPHVGSGGGYVAVRAKANTYQTTKNGHKYAVGYITNAIEGGHKTAGSRPGPKSERYRYRGRNMVPAVPGRWFYDAVRQDLDGVTQEEINELLQLIVDGLEGKL